MKTPKIIYLIKPYPSALSFEWSEDPAPSSGMKKEDAIPYARVDHVLETLNEYKKVMDLIDELNN